MDPRIPGFVHSGLGRYMVMDIPSDEVGEGLEALNGKKIPENFLDIFFSEPVPRAALRRHVFSSSLWIPLVDP